MIYKILEKIKQNSSYNKITYLSKKNWLKLTSEIKKTDFSNFTDFKLSSSDGKFMKYTNVLRDSFPNKEKMMKYSLIATAIDTVNQKSEELLNPILKSQLKINLIYDHNPENVYRIHKLTHLKDKFFMPTFFLYHSFLQSVYNVKSKKTIEIDFIREYVALKDGGQISLDWALPLRKLNPGEIPPSQKEQNQAGDSVKLEQSKNKETKAKNPLKEQLIEYEPELDRKILFVIHGLTGGSDMPYVRFLIHEAQKEGYRCVVFQNRGINKTFLKTPAPFHGVDLSDLESGLACVRSKYPGAFIYGVGLSFGGNQLIRYCANLASKQDFKAIVTIATPFDLHMCWKFIENTLYEKFFINRYIEKTLLPNMEALKPLEKTHGVNFEEIINAKTLEEFHGKFTCKVFGFKDVHDYFKRATISNEEILSIDIPTLCLHSKDDPITTRQCIPFDVIPKNKNIILAETNHGGHVCWFVGLKPQRWYPKPTLEFFNAVRDEGKEGNSIKQEKELETDEEKE